MNIPQRASSSTGQDNDQEEFTSSEKNISLDEPVPDDQGVQDGARTTTRFQYLDRCVGLYQAALKGDWQNASVLHMKYPCVFCRPITEWNDTALHIAVAAEHTDFVKELVKRMTPDAIALQNESKNTALSFAAESEIVLIAKVMVEKNPKLPLIRGSDKKTPLYTAALNGCRKMASYLYDVTPFQDLEPNERIDILVATISTDMYDIALRILKNDRTLATMENSDKRIALEELAKKTDAIGSRSQLSGWERCLNNSCFKGMCNKALMKILARKFTEHLWREVLVLPKEEFENLVDNHSKFLFGAAKLGNVEFLIILLRSYPDLIWKVNKKKQSIFHIAVKHRQESVFNLIYEIGTIKYIIAKYVDDEGNNNNMLHLAGQLGPLDRRNIIPGAPLQMQRELLWFEEIKKL